MNSVAIQLFKARDAEEGYAIRLPGTDAWLAEKGYGSQFDEVWSVEFQSPVAMDPNRVDWDQVLDRAIEAYQLSDPVVTNFDWPGAPV